MLHSGERPIFTVCALMSNFWLVCVARTMMCTSQSGAGLMGSVGSSCWATPARMASDTRIGRVDASTGADAPAGAVGRGAATGIDFLGAVDASTTGLGGGTLR